MGLPLDSWMVDFLEIPKQKIAGWSGGSPLRKTPFLVGYYWDTFDGKLLNPYCEFISQLLGFYIYIIVINRVYFLAFFLSTNFNQGCRVDDGGFIGYNKRYSCLCFGIKLAMPCHVMKYWLSGFPGHGWWTKNTMLDSTLYNHRLIIGFWTLIK